MTFLPKFPVWDRFVNWCHRSLNTKMFQYIV